MATEPPGVRKLFDLTNRTALVTGGAGWLGTAICEALAEAGARVVVTSRDAGRAAEHAATLPRVPWAEHAGVALDHLSSESLERGFQDALDVAGTLDILVNNGLDLCGKDLTNITFEEFAKHQVNNAAYFCLARLLRDHVVSQKRGASIVMIGSMYGMVASYPDAYQGVHSASPVAYHALKGGTIQMTRHLSVYWARDNVRVNTLSPGPFPQASIPELMRERLEQRSPMQRMGQPHELKGALLLFASDAGSYITGQNLVVDGGWTAW